MHNILPLILAALAAAGIIVIGCFYIAAPERVTGAFGRVPHTSPVLACVGLLSFSHKAL